MESQVKTLVDIADHGNGKPYFQELVFHVGPSRSDLGAGTFEANEPWFARRKKEAQRLLQAPLFGEAPLVGILESAFGFPMNRVFAGLTSGGIRTIVCPDLRIAALETRTQGGVALMTLIDKDPELIDRLCPVIAAVLDAGWIVAWYYGTIRKARQVPYDAPPETAR